MADDAPGTAVYRNTTYALHGVMEGADDPTAGLARAVRVMCTNMAATAAAAEEAVRERMGDASPHDGTRPRLRILAEALEALGQQATNVAELKVAANLADGAPPGTVHRSFGGGRHDA